MESFNRWVTAESVMWLGATVSLILLVLHKPISVVWISTQRDKMTRLLKMALYFVSILLVIIPCLVLISGQTLKGTACGYYLLFSICFWYYLGKNCGLAKGRKDIEDLIGLNAYEDIADAQDRLHESRMRLTTHETVVDSIKRLARGEEEPAPEDRGDKSSRHDTSGIMDVSVETVE